MLFPSKWDSFVNKKYVVIDPFVIGHFFNRIQMVSPHHNRNRDGVFAHNVFSQ